MNLMQKPFILILGAGFVHRLLFLGARQLWTDELLQALVVRFDYASGMLQRMRETVVLPAPLDYFLQKGFVLLLGESEWSLRLHAVVLGTLSIWIFFRIARLLFGGRVAVYSTLVFAFFPLTWHYSREGLPYALLLALSLLSYDLLLQRVRGGGRGRPGWALLGLILVLLLYTSLFSLLILLSQFAALLVTARFKLAAAPGHAFEEREEAAEIPPAQRLHVTVYILLAAAAVGLFVPWIRYLGAIRLPSASAPVWSPKLLLGFIKELGDNSYPVALLLLVGVVTGIRAMLLHGRLRSVIWLTTWFGIAIAGVAALSLYSRYFFAVRHVIFAMPPLILFAGYGLSYVGERLTILRRLPYQTSAPTVFYASLLIVMSVWIGLSRTWAEPADWRGVATWLQETCRPGDVVSLPKIHILLEYYKPRLPGVRLTSLESDGAVSAGKDASRRIVACFDGLDPDPCAGFREDAGREALWSRQDFAGFTVFEREP